MHWLWLRCTVNAVFSLRNWRGSTHLLAFGPSVRIAPPISQTSDCIHWCVLPRVNAFSHCFGKTIWFVLSGQLGINRCNDGNSMWYCKIWLLCDIENQCGQKICFVKMIWFVLSGQLGINRCNDRNSMWLCKIWPHCDIENQCGQKIWPHCDIENQCGQKIWPHYDIENSY